MYYVTIKRHTDMYIMCRSLKHVGAYSIHCFMFFCNIDKKGGLIVLAPPSHRLFFTAFK